MKRLTLAMALALTTFSAGAAERSVPGGAAASRPADVDVQLTQTQRQNLLAELQDRFELAASAAGRGGAVPNTKFAQLVMESDASNLLAAAEMPTYQTMIGALQGQPLDSNAMTSAIAAGGSAPKALGSTIADTTFTPLPNGRCRVADSRVINSPTVPAVVREIDVEDTGSYVSQGGNGSTVGQGSANCGIPSFTTALAVSVTVLPLGNDGFFKIFENGKAFSEGNTVLYTGAVGASNDVIVRSCQSCINELSIYSNQNTHYVVDVIGYFMPSEATALECVDTANTTSASIAAGGTANVNAPACAVGYTATATNCESSSWLVPFVFFHAGTCSARNNDVSPQTIRASRTCCRVPGR